MAGSRSVARKQVQYVYRLLHIEAEAVPLLIFIGEEGTASNITHGRILERTPDPGGRLSEPTYAKCRANWPKRQVLYMRRGERISRLAPSGGMNAPTGPKQGFRAVLSPGGVWIGT